ncbi:MAG: peptidase M20 [Candidatus Rokuibacteriota bacterium]|nr:MAG: peptidase M20 [Candidatus Rokubacteria bacterium]
MLHDWLEELCDFLRIPSVSADPAHVDDVRRAGEWVCGLVRQAGGEASLVTGGRHPLAVGEVRASGGGDAPTVLVYGHFDVQPPDPLDLWESEPFEPAVRDDMLYARGVADDKGQLYSVLKAVQALSSAGELPVHVRVACDGEEESGGDSIHRFLAADERGADACLIYDGMLIEAGVPACSVATRGMVYCHVDVRTGENDLHSGLTGGAALNAVHALTAMLSAVLPRDGRLPEPLRTGVVSPSDVERNGWARLPSGARELADRGARPADARAAEEFYVRTLAEPSLDVNGVEGGSPNLVKTVIPVEARANVSIRLVPRQDPVVIAQALESLLREAAPPGTDLQVHVLASGPPVSVDPDSRPVRLALDAVERAIGARPLLVRSGGGLPVMAALAERRIPTVLTGFAPPDCNLHAPNERMPLEAVEQGIAAAREILLAWAAL